MEGFAPSKPISYGADKAAPSIESFLKYVPVLGTRRLKNIFCISLQGIVLQQYIHVPVLDNVRGMGYLVLQFMDTILQNEARDALRNWLRTNRAARNLPMRTIAARLGVSHSWVAKTENGERRLEIIDFVNLCFALGLDPSKGLDLIVTNLSSRGGNQYGALKAADAPAPYRTRRKK